MSPLQIGKNYYDDSLTLCLKIVWTEDWIDFDSSGQRRTDILFKGPLGTWPTQSLVKSEPPSQ